MSLALRRRPRPLRSAGDTETAGASQTSTAVGDDDNILEDDNCPSVRRRLFRFLDVCIPAAARHDREQMLLNREFTIACVMLALSTAPPAWVCIACHWREGMSVVRCGLLSFYFLLTVLLACYLLSAVSVLVLVDSRRSVRFLSLSFLLPFIVVLGVLSFAYVPFKPSCFQQCFGPFFILASFS